MASGRAHDVQMVSRNQTSHRMPASGVKICHACNGTGVNDKDVTEILK
jgi:hypothetical protein